MSIWPSSRPSKQPCVECAMLAALGSRKTDHPFPASCPALSPHAIWEAGCRPWPLRLAGHAWHPRWDSAAPVILPGEGVGDRGARTHPSNCSLPSLLAEEEEPSGRRVQRESGIIHIDLMKLGGGQQGAPRECFLHTSGSFYLGCPFAGSGRLPSGLQPVAQGLLGRHLSNV